VARRIAHEIKNPLTPIQLSAERMGRKFASQIDEADRSSFHRAVDTIIRQVDVIGRLIREFSAFARMPDARMRPEPLAALVQHAADLQQSARPELRLTVDLGDSAGLYLDCDGEKISQALTNVLQNAVQAVEESAAGADQEGGGSPAPVPVVEVTVLRGDHELAILVADNGSGFPAGERQRFLEPYVTTRAKGTGLGLAIVHKIMEEHAGRVELDNSELGGALVRLVFPAERIVEGRPRPIGNRAS
jgi:two-component system nitrogen regulation sensor histidine kinase NtrY